MTAGSIVKTFGQWTASRPKKIVFGFSILFILLSAAPVVDTGSFPFPGKTVSDIITPVLMASPQIKTISGKIRKGETASSLLNDYMPLKTIYDIDKKARPVFPLTKLRRGQPYKISLLEDSFVAFEYEIDTNDRLLIRREADSYDISKLPIEYEIRQEVISVDIRSSLAEAVKRAGERTRLTWKLADIFAWDIDFIRDIRPGDAFEVLVEKRYKDGKFCGYADVKAAFFTNRGITYKAFLHENGQGRKSYFNEKGQSLEKAFLKAPLNYSRISSSFSNNRFHPILKKYRAHPGVDYAAPRNTPIKTVADGIIKSIYYSKTTGRQITIRHFSGYETAYFHMNKYAKGMKKGKKVTQGDVIGYVGKTGLATGYHLCFRMRKNGKPVNPLDQSPTAAKPVVREEMDQFAFLAGKYTQMIRAHQKLAQSD
ncbi:MAG: M23 family metallopeptidase [Desulfobacterales bacterium]|nr:M23 family metallopeptidase [Desulfobacterales bacterium]